MKEFLGIIADDLTGAGDTAVQFPCQGMPGVVIFGSTTLPGDVIAVAIDCDCRGVSAERAVAASVEGAEVLRGLGATHFYKKLDSTLRGNIAAELDAVMDALSMEAALVAPAYPANARITAGGFHLVHQIPVSESEFARDPVAPVREAHLPTLLAAGARRKVGYLGLATLHQGAEAVAAEVRRLRSEGLRVIACDATTETHLELLADLLWQQPSMIGCGSAGLAKAMAVRKAAQRSECGLGVTTEYGVNGAGRPVLVVAGSRTQVTARQVEAFGVAGAAMVAAYPEHLLEGTGGYFEQLVATTVDSLRAGQDTVLYLPVSAAIQSAPEASARLAAELGRVAGEVLSAAASVTSGVVLTGGDIAKATCRQLGATGIELETELYPAVPAGRFLAGRLAGLRVVTKGGGCGSPEIFGVAASYFKRGSATACGG